MHRVSSGSFLTLYHVTSKRNLRSILRDGLKPHYDPHLAAFGMKARVVNLATRQFATGVSAGLQQGDWITTPVYLMVTVPVESVRKINDDWYVSDRRITPSQIRVV